MTFDGSADIRERLRVPPERLTTRVDERSLGFTSTREVASLEGTIGQDRALRALEFGLGVEAPGFNIYVAGAPGSGRNTTLAGYLRNTAAGREVPDDWVYVYSFQDPLKPRALRLPHGMGRQLGRDMDELVHEVASRLPRAFESSDYQQKMEAALSDVQQRHRELAKEMAEEARKHGIGLNLTDAGIVAAPLGADGEPLTPDQIANLAREETEGLQRRQQELQGFIAHRMTELRTLEREATSVRQRVSSEVADFAMQALFAELRETYAEHAATIEYLEEVREDLVENLQMFLSDGNQSGPPLQQEMIAGGPSPQGDRTRYRINVFVDNSRTTGAPVVFEQNPSYYNVFGRVEHNGRQGMVTADFTMVHAGSIHRANGGFLVLQANDLLANPLVWQTLKQSLKNRQVRIESIGEQLSMVSTSGLEPEAIPLRLKVILVGNPNLARLLLLHDEDYPKLFKVKADFGYEMELTLENVKAYARFVVNRVQEEGLLHFDAAAVARLVEHSSRIVEDQHKLTAGLAEIANLVTEANYWAHESGHGLVGGDDVARAVSERRHRSNLVEESLQGLYDEGTIRMEVEGEVVGQINGLAVIDMGDYSFGRPSRLSASVALGRGEFSNVEQSSQMSGRIHSKGFQILIGYLMGKFGSEATMPVRASIAFEQTYEAIDGDSASSTELYAVLSSLSGVPIRQGLAVTGSVDQRGRVQAIGGATRKIEGFYDVCNAKGLTGEQGVVIPATNVRHLVLRQDVVDAIEAGRFHVFAVETIEQGLELLTGVPAGQQDAEGRYDEGTIFAKVVAALEEMSERLREPARNYRSSRNGDVKPATSVEEQRKRDRREGPGEPPTPPPA